MKKVVGIALVVLFCGGIGMWFAYPRLSTWIGKKDHTEYASEAMTMEALTANNTEGSSQSDIESNEDHTENDSLNPISMEDIVKAKGYSEDLACIIFTSGEETYRGYLDLNGNLKFYVLMDKNASNDDNYLYDLDYENGYTWFQYDGVFYVMDASGTVKSRYRLDEVSSYGAGYTWIVREEEKTWDNVGLHNYILYDADGTEVTRYNVSNEYNYESCSPSYAGGGVFTYKVVDIDGEQIEQIPMIYYAKLKKALRLNCDPDAVLEHGMKQGMIVTLDRTDESSSDSEQNPYTITLRLENGEQKEIKIPKEYANNGTELIDWSDQYLVFEGSKENQRSFYIYDIANQALKWYSGKYQGYYDRFQAYNEDDVISGSIIALRIEGADEKHYIGLIDAKTMKEIGEPIPAEDEFFLSNNVLTIRLEQGTQVYDLKQAHSYTLNEYMEIQSIDQTCMVIKDTQIYKGITNKFHYRGFNEVDLFTEINSQTGKLIAR